jgi:hypothetical protein
MEWLNSLSHSISVREPHTGRGPTQGEDKPSPLLWTSLMSCELGAIDISDSILYNYLCNI